MNWTPAAYVVIGAIIYGSAYVDTTRGCVEMPEPQACRVGAAVVSLFPAVLWPLYVSAKVWGWVR